MIFHDIRVGNALRVACGLVLSAALVTGTALAQPAAPSDQIIFEARPRFESASQASFADADALTLRTRLGWQSVPWRNLTGAIEFDNVTTLSGDYNDGVPPAEPYATIADPDGTELNRLQVAWTPNETFAGTLGRQRINLDDQRFVGASAWRQDDQTFDALRLETKQGAFQASYAFLDHINRIFADDLDWDSETHLVNASYTLNPALKISAFAYLMDFEGGGAAQSNATYGARATGAQTFGGVQFSYAASYAVQSDHGANPVAYDADYWSVDLSAARGPFTARAGYESLEGNGPGQRFITPLATLHIFQGWADVFLSTPNDGVEDLFVSGAYRVPTDAPALRNTALTIVWHQFEAERTSADLGEELDVSFSGPITEHLSFIVKYADYEGPGAPADTTRGWLGLEYKL